MHHSLSALFVVALAAFAGTVRGEGYVPESADERLCRYGIKPAKDCRPFDPKTGGSPRTDEERRAFNICAPNHCRSICRPKDKYCMQQCDKECHPGLYKQHSKDMNVGEQGNKTASKGSALAGQSSARPYLPDDLVHEHSAPESGMCSWEGALVSGHSEYTCRIYSSVSDDGRYKVIHPSKKLSLPLRRIFRRNMNAPNAWMIWAEFDRSGRVTAVSHEAERFAAGKRGGATSASPTIGGRAEATQETPRPPQTPGDLGSVLRQEIFKKLK